MTGQSFIAVLALAAVIAVLLWTLADHARNLPVDEPTGPVLFDRAGRLIGSTEELPVFRPGRHRARWFQ
jgi:hypothetical protein